MALDAIIKEKVSALGADTFSGADALKIVENVKANVFENEWLQGGVITFPKKEDIINAYVVEPVKNDDGTLRYNKKNEVIYQKYVFGTQNGAAVKVSFASLQRDVKLYTKEGESVKDNLGNFVRVKSKGALTDALVAANYDVKAFLEAIAGNSYNVVIKRHYTYDNFNSKVAEVGILETTTATTQA